MKRKIRDILRRAKNTILFYRLLLGGHRDSARALTSGRPAVILLCGWGGTRHTMSVLQGRLERDGFATYVFPLGGTLGRFNTRGIDELAKKLLKHLESIALSRASFRVAVAGHSMGGLIGRALVSMCGGERFVHTLVTIGSPHRGSPLATTAEKTPLAKHSRALKQMVPGSALLRRMAKRPIPREVYCASIFSTDDAYCPRPAAELEIPPGAENLANINAGDVGHVELVMDEETYGIIREELVRGFKRAGVDVAVT
ncbi:MAG TPA: hypothetical protein PLZ86_10025 [bacterium]|nr:hypothetical protein [bacterium]